MRSKVLLLLVLAALLVAASPSTQPIHVEPGSLLKVDLWEMPYQGIPTEMLRRVDNEGHISLPLIGRIKLQGLSLADAAKRISNLMGNTGSHLTKRGQSLAPAQLSILPRDFFMKPPHFIAKLLVRLLKPFGHAVVSVNDRAQLALALSEFVIGCDHSSVQSTNEPPPLAVAA